MRRDIDASAPAATGGARGRKLIATIGIDRYQHWQRLANAVRDATKITELFGRLGFERVTAPLLDHDATGQAIQSLVTVGLKKLLGPDDSLVLFYAGHGATYEHRPGGEEIRTGYLIPTDASSSSEDVSTWIDLEGWLRGVALLPAKHILVILDACRSGIALDGVIQRHRGEDAWQPEASTALQARRSRRIITSALGNQVALDSGPKHGHSLFTGCLLDALSHDLRRRGDQATTGTGLGTYLQHRVDAFTKSQQTPDFGSFYHDDRGEIVIQLIGADNLPSPRLNEEGPFLDLAPWDASKQLRDRVPKPGRSDDAHDPRELEPSDVDLPEGPRRVGSEQALSGRIDALSPESRRERPPVPSSLPSPLDADVAPPRTPALRVPGQEGTLKHGRDRPSRGAPLGAAELSVLLEHLEEALVKDGKAMFFCAALCFILTFSAIVATGVAAEEHVTLVATCAGLVAACALAFLVYFVRWRAIVPARMRQVIRAVRDRPDQIVQLLHFVRRDWIEIRTSTYCFVVKAKANEADLLDLLIRRCPAAKVKYL